MGLVSNSNLNGKKSVSRRIFIGVCLKNFLSTRAQQQGNDPERTMVPYLGMLWERGAIEGENHAGSCQNHR
ncbi:hypothetical protein I7I50_02194 [Histoplasma capsulatum G186AR]|uniref:Uncharacterized protein n=1 Tax=Ajellomyces capsulatus TaxID=5037 RepID=A0A8H7YAF3_AJECA|nr:hypothetical protein I7I52_12408 [Histoplasma capsulatum]QSS71381.1 hypothetical protein I7I50_02194 [Histoplasma capsulatum G186AR]